MMFNTLQPRKCHSEEMQYDSVPSNCCTSYRSYTLQRPIQFCINDGTEHKYQHSDNKASNDNSHQEKDEVSAPLLSPTSGLSAPTTISTVSSTVSSSELNHSLTSSDMSEFLSDKDRESEV